MKPEIEALEHELSQHEVERLDRWFEVNRRSFLKLLGGGLVICAVRELPAQESGQHRQRHELPRQIDSWLRIGADGKVSVYTGKVEMGQNIRTSLTQQVAEELKVPVGSVELVMGDTRMVPWDMGTFGSRTTPTMGPQLRAAAAAAREQLTLLAARQWKVNASALRAANGSIVGPGGKKITYGALTQGKKLVNFIPADPELEPPAEWKIAGTEIAKVDGRDFVTGRHKYSSDISRPGMIFGKVLRPEGLRATLESLDNNGVDKIPGVTVVRDGDFIGVTATTMAAAEDAVGRLQAKWKVPAQISDAELFSYLKQNPEPEERAESAGSVEQGRAAADVKLESRYEVAYIAHSPLEPRAAVAEWNGDQLTVWTGTQRPFAVRDELAEAFHISPDKVRVLVPDTGSAYGGKHTGECAVEAARLAKATGKPVRLVWTRREEMTWAYFRPAGVIEVRSGAAKDGRLLSWEYHNYNSGPAAIETPYEAANKEIVFHPVKEPPLRQGSYRGLAATANHFARESHMDELAHAVGIDPLEFRLRNLKDERLRAVIQAAAEKFGWAKEKSSPERGFGLAAGIEKGGRVATCVEIGFDEKKDGAIRIRRVVEAWDSGAVVNPNGLRNQIEGAIVQAIGGALFEAITFANGKVTNPRFSQYRLPRFSDAPQIEVVLIDRKNEKPAGAGETPIVGLAPAVANAVFAATGERLRSMPMRRGQ
jgi:isoquinoline 1-oxidoreductase